MTKSARVIGASMTYPSCVIRTALAYPIAIIGRLRGAIRIVINHTSSFDKKELTFV